MATWQSPAQVQTTRHRPVRRTAWLRKLVAAAATVLSAWGHAAGAEQQAWGSAMNVFGSRHDVAAMLVRYFEKMCQPRPFEVRTGASFKAHQRALRQKLLACAGLWPLPERVPLDPHASTPLDHEWCTVRRIACQLWPKVYGTGLLYTPKQFAERPAPAVLCPHGHWGDGNAHPEVQRRCLVLAKMGYVVFSPTQNHYEDLALGISHQTLMVWNNVRALDYLASLPEVDPSRIGCTGCSGGGLQAQMFVAVDDRVRAATICGMTCDYREIVFPGRMHCGCNHFPNIMRHTDEPELSALGLPTPVQYLTMNDWTRSFEKASFPTIRRLYEANGLSGRTDCKYWPTAHSYDKPKRERMYWWMEKWLRGTDHGGPVPEPETRTFPVKTLLGLKAQAPGNKGFRHISRIYANTRRYAVPKIASRRDWEAYRKAMRAALRELLGEPPPAARAPAKRVRAEEQGGLTIERLLCPSEGGILVPTLLVRATPSKGRLPVVVVCDDRGKDAAWAATGASSAAVLAHKGCLVVLPDVRFVGELSLRAMAGLTRELTTFKACSPLSEGPPASFDGVWERNAVLWGRPIPGMAATDIRAVVDAVAARADVDVRQISLRGRGRLAIAALFAAALDDRVAAVDMDLGGRCFEKRNLPLVPFVLQHGDVLQWAALLADRRLTLAGVPREAGDPRWLEDVFGAAGNPDGLDMGGVSHAPMP